VRRKITVVGGDSLAAAVALLLAERDYGDVVLLGDETAPATPAAVSDLRHVAALSGCESRVTGSSGWDAVAGSAVVVLPDAVPERLVDAAASVARFCPDAVVIVAAEPPELVALALERTLFPRQRVIGCGPLVESARLRDALAAELGASVRDVQALVLGGPGHTAVPVLSSSTVAGARVAELLAPDRLPELVQQACRDGRPAPPVSFAMAGAVRGLVDAIAADCGRVLPCAVQCRGEYGLEPVVLGVPSRLGAGGVEEIVELALDDTERAALDRAAALLRSRQPVNDRRAAAPAPAR
jgi:malate dehydrogenase